MHIPIPSNHRWPACAMPILLLMSLGAQNAAPEPARPAANIATAFDHVLHDDPGTGAHWACGLDWKASFDRDGFTFIPCFGAKAPRNFPIAFAVVGVRVGGHELAIARHAEPEVQGDRVQFDRGALREIYDTNIRHVAQSFVVDTTLPGDVEVEILVTSELRHDATRDGLQFGNEFGAVDYGSAFLVRDGQRLPIPTTFDGGALRLRVPGELRGSGPVVIDPIINTDVASYLVTVLYATGFPDISYIYQPGRYLAVWERTFSATDHDVLSEFFDDDGDTLAASGAAIDIGPADCRVPRVASVIDPARFLVVYERVDPAQWNGRSMIYGRMRQADGLTPLQPEIMISQPNWTGANTSPDIGGDPLPAPGATRWAIVWTHTLGTSSTIHRRAMRSDLVFVTQDDELAAESGHPLYSPQISSSNGNGLVGNPGWLVVYSRMDAGGDVDVGGAFLTPGMVTSGPLPLDYGPDQDLYAFVSSPVTDVTGGPSRFLVTFERQGPQAARALIFDATTSTIGGQTDLTQTFGIGPYWTRADSDGTRFVVAASDGATAQSVGLSTLAFDGQAFAVHESSQLLPGLVAFPQVVGDGACGGRPNHYATVYQDTTTSPARTMVSKYIGHATGPQITARHLACHGLQCATNGQPLLGQAVQFQLGSVGNAIPGFAIGLPSGAPIPICAMCSVGFRLDLAFVLAFGSPQFALAIPPDVGLVGRSVTVQGVSVGAGSCLGSIALSDAFDLTIR